MRFFVIDTETTGLAAPIKPVEIAWVEVTESLEVLSETVHRVNPLRPIDPGATAIHGIHDSDVASSPVPEEVLADFPPGFCFIGHNTSYDQRVLSPWVMWGAEVCTLSLARRYLPQAPNHKLVTLKTHLGLSDQTAHSALGDCRTSLELLRYLSGATGKSLSQFIELGREPKILHVMPFGRYKGRNMVDLPLGYKQWLWSLPDLHKDLRHTIHKLRLL